MVGVLFLEPDRDKANDSADSVDRQFTMTMGGSGGWWKRRVVRSSSPMSAGSFL